MQKVLRVKGRGKAKGERQKKKLERVVSPNIFGLMYMHRIEILQIFVVNLREICLVQNSFSKSGIMATK